MQIKKMCEKLRREKVKHTITILFWTDFVGEKYELLENKFVWSVAVDKDSNKWVGTVFHGLIAFGPTVTQQVYHDNKVYK